MHTERFSAGVVLAEDREEDEGKDEAAGAGAELRVVLLDEVEDEVDSVGSSDTTKIFFASSLSTGNNVENE
jgi:hypothetical protein